MIVVDASIVVKWAVEEPGRPEALAVLEADGPFVAPDLIFAELANVLRRKERMGEIAVEQTALAVEAVAGALFATFPSSDVWPEALRLARLLDHSVYDCMYLAVALDRGPLVTADEKFARKCAENGLGAVVALPSDLTSKAQNWVPANATTKSN